MQFENSTQLCKHVAGSDRGACLLAFSTGKDSIGAWIQLRRHFDTITPFYLYLVPGLSFVEESLSYYENYFSTKIIRLPHPSLYRWLNNYVFQAPENCQVIDDMGLPDFDYQDIQRIIAEDYNLPAGLFTAQGVRAVDSLNRWASIKKHGPINHNKQTFYPIYDWNKETLLREIASEGIMLPVDYHMFGRSFDGIDYRFLKPIRDNYPQDYNKILEYFPLADLELARVEYRSRYNA
jgi:hypothetical protein